MACHVLPLFWFGHSAARVGSWFGSWFATPAWLHLPVLMPFWLTTMAWEGMAYLCFGSASDDQVGSSSRRSRRALANCLHRRRHDSFRRLPDIICLPLCWLVFTGTVLMPSSWSDPVPTIGRLFTLSARISIATSVGLIRR